MQLKKEFILSLIVITMSFFQMFSALGQENHSEKKKYALSLFYAQNCDSELLEIITLRAKDWQSYKIVGLGLTRQLFEAKDHFTFELSAQGAKHIEEKNFYEGDFFVTLRAQNFPWDHYLLNTFAFGDGVSYVTRYPTPEAKNDNVHKKLLNYILVEATFAHPKHPSWWLSLRIHHRSAVFGLYGANGGSDYVGMALTKWL